MTRHTLLILATTLASIVELDPAVAQVLGNGEAQCQAIAIPVDEPTPTAFGLGGGALVINATFGTGATITRRAVIQQAINEWQGIIQASGTTPNPYPISITFGSFGPTSTLLALTTTSFRSDTGNLVSATMAFNTDRTWFEDPTPGDDGEFAPGCAPPGCQPPPAGSFDLLSVARHELGHALGWIAGTGTRVAPLMVGSAFNPPRLNIPVVIGVGPHTDPSWSGNDIMVPAIGPTTRRPISLYPAASLLARAYGYGIPLQFVDPTHPGVQNGTATNPWRTLAVACAVPPSGPPPGTPLLLSNATHVVSPSLICQTEHVLDAARGGAIVTP